MARAAAVSPQTVSRVLNGHPNVRPATRERILGVIDRLGYQPNLAARALASGRSTQLGVVAVNSVLLGPVATLYAVEQAARRCGYSVSVTSVRSIDRRSISESLSYLVGQGIAGVIIIAPVASRDAALEALPSRLPTVVVEADPGSCSPAVMVDSKLGAALATQHLLGLGHATVFHVSGPREWIGAQHRVAGWRQALEAAGAPVPEMIRGDWSPKAGYEAGQILVDIPDATAVFAANDNIALGVLRAFSERGRQVPEDVSVIGFDDIPEARFFTPPLTSVRQNFAEIGRRSVEMLERQITTSERATENVMIAPDLVLRESTARPCFGRAAEKNDGLSIDRTML